MEEIKQVILVRADLEMGKGKLAVQVAHASLLSYLEALNKDKSIVEKWLRNGQKKIALKVSNEDDLIRFYKAFQYKNIPCALVEDAGLTELPPGTKTALGIGPWYSNEIDVLTKNLKLL